MELKLEVPANKITDKQFGVDYHISSGLVILENKIVKMLDL